MLAIQEIMAIIPHRYPFLLIDRVLDIESGVRAAGEKLVSINEPFFAGHFPGQPVMPGVLIFEALAQLGAVALLSQPDHQGKQPYLAGLDDARVRRPVVPGDVLRLEVTLEKFRRGIGRGTGTAHVADQLAAEATLLFAINEQTAL
jgi:3-hydroxyacyl-[acyl-carrier-protein] dehydratase